MTRDELVDLLPQRREKTLRDLRTLFERLRAPNILAVPSPRVVESTEGRAFDVVLFGLTPAAAAVIFPARALRLAHLPFRVGRLPVAGEAQPVEVNDLQLSDTKPFNVSRDHFTIERVPDHHVASVPLAVGENEVVAGSPRSPFRFRVVVALRQPNSCPDQELHSAYRD